MARGTRGAMGAWLVVAGMTTFGCRQILGIGGADFGSSSSAGGGGGGGSTSSTSSATSTTSSTATTSTTSGGPPDGGMMCVPTPDPTQVWSGVYGDEGSTTYNTQQGTCVVVDAAGGAVVAGLYDGTVDFGLGALPTTIQSQPYFLDTGAFVTRFDASGKAKYSLAITSDTGVYVQNLAVDSSGNAVVLGYILGTTHIGSTVLTTDMAYGDLFVAKISPTGAVMWARVVGGPSSETTGGLAIDDTGSIYVSGYFITSITIDGQTFPSTGYSDSFVARLGPDGSLDWFRTFGCGTDTNGVSDGVNALAADSNGVYVLGYVSDSPMKCAWKLGADSFTSRGNSDVVLAALSKTGTPLWAKQIGGSSIDQAMGITVGKQGPFVWGNFVGSLTLPDGSQLNAMGGSMDSDLFLASFALDGKLNFARSYGSFKTETATRISYEGHATGDDLLWVTGISAGSSLHLGCDPVANNSSQGIFLGSIQAQDGKGLLATFASSTPPGQAYINDIYASGAGKLGIAGAIGGGAKLLLGGAKVEDKGNGSMDAFAAVLATH